MVLALNKVGKDTNKDYETYSFSQHSQLDTLVKGYELDGNKLVKVKGCSNGGENARADARANGRRMNVSKAGDYYRSVAAALNALGL